MVCRWVAAAAAIACSLAQPAYVSFGGAISQGTISTTEQSLFFHKLSPGATHGVLTHWWITGGGATNAQSIISMYIDGETTPSIVFNPSLAIGIGFDDNVVFQTSLVGKNSIYGSQNSKIRIPFQSSINVTYRLPSGSDVVYFIARGVENLPITVGGVTLPPTARLNQQVVSGTFQPLQYVPLVNITAGNGVVFLWTLAFTAPNLNTLEGCLRLQTPYTAPYPGLLVATGTEDAFDSSYYFAAGRFQGDNSGLTHVNATGSPVTLSAYRYYDADPLWFAGGAQFIWRNGDTTDPATGLKCTLQSGGRTVGTPGPAQVLTYTWVYTW